MPMLTWFNAIVSVLLYLGALQVVTKVLGGILYFCMGTSPVEAFVAAADIFLGPVSCTL
jgi:nucleoside permease NupC